MKYHKPEPWMSVNDDDLLDSFRDTLKRMKVLLMNTPPDKMGEFQNRFAMELEAIKRVEELQEEWARESSHDCAVQGEIERAGD